MKQLFLPALLLCFFSCKKDEAPAPVKITADALVIDEGVNIADGCGWHVIANGVDYIPDNLSHEFESDSLPVRVTFTSADSAGCGFTANLNTHPVMNVESMELR